MSAPAVLLVARREYLAYVGAWGFWVSLITAPLLMAALMFAPLLLARAEPPRVLAIVAERGADVEAVAAAFEARARAGARAELEAYLRAAAPALTADALSAFDAAPDSTAAIAAARARVAAAQPRALAAFPAPSPRYVIAPAPAPDIEGLKPYLDGRQALADGRTLFGALNIRRNGAGAPTIEYWSVNLQHDEAADLARGAMRLEMQREALVAQGLGAEEANRLDALWPAVRQFDPRPSAGAAPVTLRERAPFYAAIALAFVLWSVVFSVANMLLSGVIEEKSNKILDTLLTSVSPLEVLLGKLLGVAMVSATLFAVWGGLGGALLGATSAQMSESFVGQIAPAFLEPRLMAAFAVGFVSGYLMYGAIFLALGALCETIQDAQSLVGPAAIVLTVPMLLLGPALDNPNAPLIEAASWIPLFTPFLLLVRAPADLPWADIAGMGALMLLTLTLVLLLAARVFQAGVSNELTVASLFRRKRRAG